MEAAVFAPMDEKQYDVVCFTHEDLVKAVHGEGIGVYEYSPPTMPREGKRWLTGPADLSQALRPMQCRYLIEVTHISTPDDKGWRNFVWEIVSDADEGNRAAYMIGAALQHVAAVGAAAALAEALRLEADGRVEPPGHEPVPARAD